MVSAVFIEPATETKTDRCDGACHAVAPFVRVRKEAFGLLFYNTEESRLTFVKSAHLLQIRTLPDGGKTIVADIKPETRMKVRKLLDHLLQKRLISDA
jgi:putative mycofactocin binding protein MftB